MIEQLSIKNFAIIEDLEVSFENGFTCLCGETGAGKSIIIDAINLLLGERSSFDPLLQLYAGRPRRRAGAYPLARAEGAYV